MICLSIETLDKLNIVETANRAALKKQKARFYTLAKASNFLKDLSLDSKALFGLFASFWKNLAYSSSFIAVLLKLDFF